MTSEPSEMDSAHIEALKRSADQVGFLSRVLVEKGPRPGTLLSGRHRKGANPSWPTEEVEVKDDLHRELIMIHANIQRRVSDEATAARIKRIAQILESQGVPKPDICTKISELVPFSARWIRELLPAEYKHVEKQRQRAEVVPQKSTEPELGPTSDQPPKELAEKLLDLTPAQKALLKPFEPTATLPHREDSSMTFKYPFPECICGNCPRHAACYK